MILNKKDEFIKKFPVICHSFYLSLWLWQLNCLQLLNMMYYEFLLICQQKTIKLMKQTQTELNSTQTTPTLAPISMKE